MFRLLVAFWLLIVAIQGASLSPVGQPLRHRNIYKGNEKIVGGIETTIDTAPWQVAIDETRIYLCAGSIVAPYYILTTASCMLFIDPHNIGVRSGATRWDRGGTRTFVHYIYRHPDYSTFQLDYDAAILELSFPIEFNELQRPIALKLTEPSINETAQIAGWGALVDGSYQVSNNLHSVEVPITDHGECEVAYRTLFIIITAREFCAGAVGKDSCFGDTGSALTLNGQQVGIMSFDHGCGQPGFPTVYTNVAHPAIKGFIDEMTQNQTQWSE